MKTTATTAAAVVCVAAALAPVAQAQQHSDFTGGRPVPAGTHVPFEPGYATQWYSYDVVKFGDPRFWDDNVRGVRVLGQFDQDSVLCLINAKGGMWGCYIDGEEATELAYMPSGKVITNDPVVKLFAPVISLGLQARMSVASLLHLVGSSLI